ncbi:MAG: hypothetical protein QOJ59_3003 [Thermomicrobiales bacterium]|nr:hypothetical protein [Thermomicrobiales bacterium]MEA2525933.1 hypothetical protein [Thermomicrobiales bacterium]
MDLKQRLLRWDIVAGGAALLVVVLALGLEAPTLLAFVLAIAAYLVVVLVRAPRDADGGTSSGDSEERSALAYETSLQKVAAMRGLAERIEREGTREVVLRMADHSDQALEVMAERNARAAAPLYLEQLLEPAEALIETYVRLSSRGLKATDEILARNESQDFPMLERASRLFLERIRQEDAVDLPALTQVLTFSLESTTPIVQPNRKR